MIAFIDTEVGIDSRRTMDYGAIREDGAQIHSRSLSDFALFIKDCGFVCGHNIIHHDLQYLNIPQQIHAIDTLYLSPLLFPQRPYHRLVKDDKLQVDELNNPLNDAIKARDLFYDELTAWKRLPERRKTIYYLLLRNVAEFKAFFEYIGIDISFPFSWVVADIIRQEYKGYICSNANVAAVADKYPVELAFALSIIGVGDPGSITPPWVVHTYPKVTNVIHLLCGTPCDGCEYCSKRLDAHAALKEFFGYKEFRLFDGVPMQQQAVESAIRNESLLCIFPTGGGKSLTFQLPALLLGRNERGLTVVISPLQSLMKDQVDNLSNRGISTAVTINGLLDPIERSAAIQQVAEGSADMLYISPEMLRNKTIERLLLGRNVVRFVIDEAHCFSAWGQDFRVDYLYIGDFIRHIQEQKKQKNPIPVSCFTATAKPKVVADICDYFRQKIGVELRLFTASSERKNLRYSVLQANTHDEKYHLLRSLLIGRSCPAIVYCARTKRTKELAAKLRSDGIRALPFNGKMEAADKIRNQEAFMSGDAQVIVATSAFGMGVDKKDVGLVVHYDISDSLENYIQEAGRAGRDPNMEADCYVLYSDNDLDKHFILLNQTKLSLSEIRQVWRAVRDMTVQRPTIGCSALEIARKAGWGDEVPDIETRVRAALAALENAGFIVRGSNSPHLFATGITVNTMDEVRHRLSVSPLFDDTTREQSARIIGSLISKRATSANNTEAESRIDYLADLLGMTKETVISSINLMRQEGILADTQDMQIWVDKINLKRLLDITLQLEQFLIQQITKGCPHLNYKQLNQQALMEGLKNSTPRRLRTLLSFLALKGYLRKSEHAESDSVSIYLLLEKDDINARFGRRADLCYYIVSTIGAQAVQLHKENPSQYVTFSLVDQLRNYNDTHITLEPKPSLADMQEAFLYLSRNEVLKIDGGFMVIYNTMQLERKVERRTQYGKEQYRLLDAFYRQRMQQIHIVGEYANMMVKDYPAATKYVNDYFTLDYNLFIRQYFKGERKTEISRNITPSKYHQLFATLSARQRQIIDDKESQYIVVAAGPGSGKTRVLVHKLASLLLMEDVKHEQLLMLTFSRAAATEFKRRLIDLVGNAAHYVDIKTFHSFAFDLLGQLGSLEEVDQVVDRAAEMIEKGEVEERKVAKSVLVIDEAQDMSKEDFRLVRALLQRNEEMRIIAVGDDDQNIYHFRGSNSAYMRSLVDQQGATLYEMTDNYRSDQAIVNFANDFVCRIPNRMKCSPIVSTSESLGSVDILPKSSLSTITETPFADTTAILTFTNEEALQAAYHLERQGYHPLLIQATEGFRFINLAEIRYFVKQFGKDSDIVIPKDVWETAKQRTEQTYANSRLLPVIQRFWKDYEQTHRSFYRTDLRQFLLESNIEDFASIDGKSVYVSTIHKAKGREFDAVHLWLFGLHDIDVDTLRTLYVGMTRARHNLYIHSDSPLFDQRPLDVQKQQEKRIIITLSMRDVWLDYFRDHKAEVLALRSGDKLRYRNGILYSEQNQPIASLSKGKREDISKLNRQGYQVIDAEVSYVLAWRPREEPQEVAVCLANLYMEKVL